MTAQGDPLFATVLVANRGEIARRVIRTLRRLAIRSIAVYSDVDASAPHVREADAAVRIGPAAAASSYLDIDAVIAAARATGAEAIHPGYGFLSENPSLARACEQAGIIFIGPDVAALEVMADKIRAREHVSASGVPIVPGFSAAGMDDGRIREAADEAGYPLLIKPSAGGGGKGMVEVYGPDELPDAVAGARRVAAAAFADDTLLFERLITRPRHIEVQVLGDREGTVIPVGERECTLQRRHQKVIEEAPSPVIDAATRQRLGEAACAAAASVDYVGAGTVEFIVSADRPEEFFFMEMNTRLQVEHPVTELVTGIDLVEQQVRIAAGQGLEIGEVHLDGHAVEARVYAESPARGFLPATGPVLWFEGAPGVRTDAAVETGSVVTADYDPMIAKVIAHGATRDEALQRLDEALAETILFGVESNIAFLRALVAEADVRSGRMDTGLIARMGTVTDPEPTPDAFARAAACLAGSAGTAPDADRDPARVRPPWTTMPGWRAGADPVPARTWFVTATGVLHEVEPDIDPELVQAPAVRGADGTVWVHVGGVTSALTPISRRDALMHRMAAAGGRDEASDPDLRAPMPGTVVAVHAQEGERVHRGQRILSIEAMKMEHPVTAAHDGVLSVRVHVGDQVGRDQVVARVRADTDGT